MSKREPVKFQGDGTGFAGKFTGDETGDEYVIVAPSFESLKKIALALGEKTVTEKLVQKVRLMPA